VGPKPHWRLLRHLFQVKDCSTAAGRIAQKTAEPGNQVQPGGALMAVVEDNVWVLANLKETQLKRVQIGQPTEYGGPQFQLANLVRVIGQPLTIVPLSAIATAGLAKRDQTDGSALFNILRNLGGSVGIALLSRILLSVNSFMTRGLARVSPLIAFTFKVFFGCRHRRICIMAEIHIWQ
jgi:hypothetical protein